MTWPARFALAVIASTSASSMAWAVDLAVPGGGAAVEVHGFISQGAIKSTGNNYLVHSKRGSFEFNEVGINFTTGLTSRLHLGVQLFAHDLGSVGNYNAKFDWLYLDYRFADWLALRAGRTKLPFGLYNEINDVDAARNPILLPQSAYPILNRDILLAQTGLELYGYATLGPVGGLEYRLYGGTVTIEVGAPAPPLRLARAGVPYLLGGRVLWETPVNGLRAGVSLQTLRLEASYSLDPGAPPIFMGLAELGLPFVLWLGSLEYVAGHLSLAAEYGRWRGDVESNVPLLVPPSKTVNERFYAMAGWQLTSWLTPCAYYSVIFPKVERREGRDAYQHDVAATLRFDITAHWIVKLEGHFIRGTAELASNLNDNKPLADLQRDWLLFLAKTTAYF